VIARSATGLSPSQTKFTSEGTLKMDDAFRFARKASFSQGSPADGLRKNSLRSEPYSD